MSLDLPTPTATVAAVQAKLASLATAINTFVAGFLGNDLDAAIALATSKNDAQAVACWNTIKALALEPIPAGAGIAYLIQYARNLVAYQGQVNTSCGTVLPAFVLAYNDMVAALVQFGNSTLPTAAIGAAGVVGAQVAPALGAALPAA
jgi:uncharacterized membrane protein